MYGMDEWINCAAGAGRMGQEKVVEEEEDIVIVGAGLAGLTTSLGLYRLGIRSVVLESADTLRVEGYALSLWTNAWKALDAVGVGNNLRVNHIQITRILHTALNSGLPIAEFTVEGDREVRRIKRKVLLGTLKNELPEGTIRYSSKVAHIQDDPYSFYKLIHLADGTTLKTKLLIGCDGVNSVVANYLGFSKPSFTGQVSMRGNVEFKDEHGFEPEFLQSFGNGVRYGLIPTSAHGVTWYLTFTPSSQDEEGMLKDGEKMKKFVLSKLDNASEKVKALFENTNPNTMSCSQLKYRHPWELFRGNISRDNVCVAGDALHPMTPYLGQGGSSSIEEGVVLARIIAQALTETGYSENLQQQRIKAALERYAKERRWRSIKLVIASYMAGYIQHKDTIVLRFVRDKLLPKPLLAMLLWMSDFDCGSLTQSSTGLNHHAPLPLTGANDDDA